MFCTDSCHKQPLGEVLHSVEICFLTSLLKIPKTTKNSHLRMTEPAAAQTKKGRQSESWENKKKCICCSFSGGRQVVHICLHTNETLHLSVCTIDVYVCTFLGNKISINQSTWWNTDFIFCKTTEILAKMDSILDLDSTACIWPAFNDFKTFMQLCTILMWYQMIQPFGHGIPYYWNTSQTVQYQWEQGPSFPGIHINNFHNMAM